MRSTLVDGSSPGTPAALGNPAHQDDAWPGEGGRHEAQHSSHDAQHSSHKAWHDGERDGQTQLHPEGQPTIYDVARVAGVSIASVSRVLNGRRNTLPDTRERVERAVAELGFIPDGAARALSARLKEVVGVVIRR